MALIRRTTLRKAFLAPWHPDVAQAWLYSLAEAQRRTQVAVHHAIRVITHQHLSVTGEKANLSEFTALAHHDISCSLNTLLAHHNYDQPGELFDDRSAHVMRLCDAPAQSTHIIYEYLNCVAAGLVARPEHMPGYLFDFELWKKGSLEIKKPDFYFGKDRPAALQLIVTPPPLLFRAFDGDLDALVYHMTRTANDMVRELRAHQSRPPLGARHIQQLHPWSEPRTLRESRGTRVPTFRIGARGVAGRQMRIEAAQETTAFRRSHREARQAWAVGDREAVFPFGTYQMRVQHGCRVADPPEPGGGLICRPGPLLCDVQAELELERARRRAHGEQSTSPPQRFALVDETREALRDEASELCEHASQGMDFHAPPAPAQTTADDRTAVVRHRFTRPHPGRDIVARRVVTLRDRRIGRPPGARHGNDPPV